MTINGGPPTDEAKPWICPVMGGHSLGHWQTTAPLRENLSWFFAPDISDVRVSGPALRGLHFPRSRRRRARIHLRYDAEFPVIPLGDLGAEPTGSRLLDQRHAASSESAAGHP